MPSLLQRLKERKIVQWAVVYLAGAWLFLEALGFVADTFAWPAFVARSAVVLAAVGFFAVLVLAWYHGEKGRQRASGVELLILAGILVIAGAAVALLGRGRHAPDERVAVQGILPPETVDSKSVAVLPFANLGNDPENEFFSDGMTGDIINHLVRIADLKVISRTSAMQYKNTDKNLRQIGQELGVATIVEGEVQRVGNRVRINAQLIDANTDVHLWAEQYNRQVEDVFKVQSDIARRIAVALQATLVPTEKQEVVEPTDNAEAYEYYLRARAENDFDSGVEMLQRAVELDPDFAAAWAELAEWWIGGSFNRMDPDLRERGVEALNRAIDLAPEAFETYLARATYHRLVEQDYERALEQNRAAERLRPNDAMLLGDKGWTLLFTGQWDAALAAFEKAAVLDPLNSDVALWLARTHRRLGNVVEAERYFDRAIALDASDPAAYDWKFRFLLENVGDTTRAREFAGQHPERSEELLAQLDYVRRDYEKALEFYLSEPGSWRMLQSIYRAMNDPAGVRAIADSVAPVLEAQLNRTIEAQAGPTNIAFIHLGLGQQYADLGDREAAIRQAELAIEYSVSVDAWNYATLLQGVARIYTLLGEHDRAIDYLEEMLSVPTRYSAVYLRISPGYDPLRDHSRFQALLAKYE